MRKLLAISILILFVVPAGGHCLGAELLSGPYTIAPRTDGATVCWQTTAPAPGKVRYRAGGTKAWREAPGGKAQFQAVALKGLKSGTSYEVEVCSGAAKLGGLSFRTAPKKLDSFTFYVYGDTRSNPDAHSQVARALAAEARRRKQLTFVVLTGDLADYNADAKETAEQFFRPAAPVLEIMPLLALRGNHECATDLFKKYFPEPARPEAAENPDDYAVDWGSARVIIMDQYGPARPDGPRMKWLGGLLAGAKDKWRFVAFHEPMYSSGSHGPSKTWRYLALPVMRAGGVHAVFCGHDHNYERIKPQYGITQFVTGGGGAPLREVTAEPMSYSAKFKAVHHFLSVEVTPQKLTVKAHTIPDWASKSEVFDSVEIPRDCKWATATAESPAPTGARGGREALWGYRRNPWKMRILVAGVALLLVALALKAIKVARRKSEEKKSS